MKWDYELCLCSLKKAQNLKGKSKLHSNNVYSFFFFFAEPCCLSVEESSCNAGDVGLIPGSGRFSGEGNSNPLQYSCLGNAMDRGVWWATVHGATKELDVTE